MTNAITRVEFIAAKNMAEKR